MLHVGHIEEALIAAFRADAGLVALVGSAERIIKEFPQKDIGFPLLTVDIVSENPIGNASYTGEYMPNIDIGVYGPRKAALWDVAAYLETNWTIPVNRPAFLASDGMELQIFRRVNTIVGPPVMDAIANQKVRLLAMEWDSKIKTVA